MAQDTRWKQQLENLQKAFLDFEEACKLTQYTKLERSGLIQTFEFTFELAWKTLQSVLQYRGYLGALGPRPVLQQAFKDGIIQNGEIWMKMLESRNLTVHSYDEKTAEEIATLAKRDYFPLLSQLVTTLKNET